MNSDLVKRIAEKFNSEGYVIFEVGGHVRDSLMGRESNDIDCATNALPRETKRILEEFGSVYDVGAEYGTIGLNTDEVNVEITTLRKEVYPSESRKPIVEFSTSDSFDALYEDLSRRDFTINAIAREPLTGAIIDPFYGQRDIENRIIRCVGNDRDRFNEDPLRMMRAIRFSCQLGFSTEVKMPNPERLRIVSKERIRDELSKILLTRRASNGIIGLCNRGLMNYIVPDFMRLKDLQQDSKWHMKDAFKHSLMVLSKGSRMHFEDGDLCFRLACWLHDISKPETMTEDETGIHFYSHQYFGAERTERILTDLRFDNDTIERTRELVYFHMSPLMLYRGYEEGGLNKRSVIRLIRKIGEDNIYLLLGLVKCDMRSSKNSRREFLKVLTKIVDECMEEEPEQIKSPLNGTELMRILGLKPSPLIGTLKSHLTNLVIDGTLAKDDKIDAIVRAREKLRAIREGNGDDEDID